MLWLPVRVVLVILFAVAVSASAAAGPRTYDISSIVFAAHPFASSGPLPPVVAAPVRPAVTRPGMPSRAAAGARMAPAQRAPAVAQSAAAKPQSAAREDILGILSEIRVGVLAHDEGPFSRHEEGGIDANFELLFTSPAVFDLIWSPRPHIGFSINSAGNTSQLYAGLSWEWSFAGNWFAGFSLGGAVHDGETTTAELDRKELGCHMLFRESVEVGYRFGGRHGISAFLDHISNARLCDANEGLETVGIRYGYHF